MTELVVQGQVTDVFHAGERLLAYVRIPAPEGSGRKTALVTLFDPPAALARHDAVEVRRGEAGRWELAPASRRSAS